MKKGFTLAEVLITLAVIGVIAALTIPFLVVSYQKHQALSALKKNYAVLNQAVKLAEADYGSMDTWEPSDFRDKTKFADKYLKPYLHTISIPPNTASYPIYLLNGNGFGNFVPDFALADGTLIKLGAATETPAQIYEFGLTIDINGKNKPNTYGKDLFWFKYHGNCLTELNRDKTCGPNHTVPGTLQAAWQEKPPALLAADCNKNGSGNWCAAKIIKDGWEIKYDW